LLHPQLLDWVEQARRDMTALWDASALHANTGRKPAFTLFQELCHTGQGLGPVELRRFALKLVGPRAAAAITAPALTPCLIRGST
jgi:hypothetical protein